MFIDSRLTESALRQEGHVSRWIVDEMRHGPPGGGRRLVARSINMVLLTEDKPSGWCFHFPLRSLGRAPRVCAKS